MHYFMHKGLQFFSISQTCPFTGLCACIKYFGIAHKMVQLEQPTMFIYQAAP